MDDQKPNPSAEGANGKQERRRGRPELPPPPVRVEVDLERSPAKIVDEAMLWSTSLSGLIHETLFGDSADGRPKKKARRN